MQAQALSLCIHVNDSSVQDGLLEKHESMYASYRFMSGPDCQTSRVQSNKATLDSIVTGKYRLDAALLRYMQDSMLEVKLHKEHNYAQVVFAVARFPLVEVLQAFVAGQGGMYTHQSCILYVTHYGSAAH